MVRSLDLIAAAAILGLCPQLVSAIAAAGQSAFVGCYSTNDIDGVTSEGAAWVDSSVECAAHCQSLSPSAVVYSFFSGSSHWDISHPGDNCFCSTAHPPASALAHSSSLTAPDECHDTATAQAAAVHRSGPHPDFGFGFQGCYPRARSGEPTQYATDLDEIFTACGAYRSVFISAVREGDNRFAYRCGAITNIMPVQCGPGPGVGYFYTQESGYLRTNHFAYPGKRSRLAGRDEQVAFSKCPIGLKACRLEGTMSDDDYDCVDIRHDVEECGGCLYGDYDGEGVGDTSGIDCTEAEGSAGAICIRGTCHQLYCEPGYKLNRGVCYAVEEAPAAPEPTVPETKTEEQQEQNGGPIEDPPTAGEILQEALAHGHGHGVMGSDPSSDDALEDGGEESIDVQGYDAETMDTGHESFVELDNVEASEPASTEGVDAQAEEEMEISLEWLEADTI